MLNACGWNISIHLMLLFNLTLLSKYHTIFINFNTSNVTIQQFLLRTNWRCLHISIHLMLLFNSSDIFLILSALDFNTSNVTIQLLTGIMCKGVMIISIHLMLLFNQVSVALKAYINSFQYI